MQRRHFIQLSVVSATAGSLGAYGCANVDTARRPALPLGREPYSVSSSDGRFTYEVWPYEHLVTVTRHDDGSVRELGGLGSGDGQLNFPGAVALTDDGRVLVADRGNARLCVLSADGALLGYIGEFGFKEGRLARPRDIATAASGEIFVADSLRHSVVVFASNGQFLREFGGLGLERGRLNGPVALTIGDDGRVHVLEAGNARISLFDADGTFIAAFAGYGSGPGRLRLPHAMAIDAGDRLLVRDAADDGQVSVFSREGEFLEAYRYAG